MVVAHDIAETDIRSRAAVAATLMAVQPDVVINAAAYTNVDAAESNPDEAFAVNAEAAGILAGAAAEARSRFIHVSTDYVFDGRAHSPYATTADVGPVNVYGATKLEGERRVVVAAPESTIVRTAWVHSDGGSNFVRTAVRVLTLGRTMRVVDDQIGTPTRARNLATAIWRVVERPQLRGILHFTDSGVASWFDVARTVLETLRTLDRLPPGADVTPIATDEYPTPARRPAYSVLEKHGSWRAMDYVPPHWREGVIASTCELLNA
jgi:dTDP-4-dehydrorhamnose reductase